MLTKGLRTTAAILLVGALAASCVAGPDDTRHGYRPGEYQQKVGEAQVGAAFAGAILGGVLGAAIDNNNGYGYGGGYRGYRHGGYGGHRYYRNHW